ncbi:hypothetical protein N7466_000088 [Penicillium verhagenii]|uniref:uncharacterized protein n=1 Tax=Penicillium verhagenii TaxID=1562060 RepID=UPI0025456B2C|nr:uncharacterized protein N7466_000088 [Penicillium verhagenii]KAJ5947073.1 hypothetical protein N7466_000088 [Penicillium verhagenii]
MASQANNRLAFQETDETDSPTATYVFSEQDSSKGSRARVDVMSSPPTSSWSAKPLVTTLRDIFLPSGYPQSVSDDYLPYQIFDSLQAFCSSIAGLLSSRAVLQGVGVGNASASPTNALLLHILQDSSGRVATILFAHRVGTALEPECKTYRLAADVFNDIAMILDCLSPMVPAGVARVTVLSAAGILRALCGVAGGSSKASLSAHFSRWGNLAELNAKDSSQETVISLLGMLVGSLVISHITGFKTTWAALLVLLAAHLSLNYAAVRAVQMTSLNRQRANIVFSAFLSSLDDSLLTTNQSTSKQVTSNNNNKQPTILTPAQASHQERIFPRDGVLEWTPSPSTPSTYLGTAEIGVSLPQFLTTTHSHPHSSTTTSGASFQTSIPMEKLHKLFADEGHILFLFPRGRGQGTAKSTWHASMLLKKGCSVQAQLKAWMHALLAARVLSESEVPTDGGVEDVFSAVERTLGVLNAGASERCFAALAGVGWVLDIGALETRGGRRVACVE